MTNTAFRVEVQARSASVSRSVTGALPGLFGFQIGLVPGLAVQLRLDLVLAAFAVAGCAPLAILSPIVLRIDFADLRFRIGFSHA